MSNIQQSDQGFGSLVDSVELIRFLSKVIADNLRLESDDKATMPVCIWGRHGIGKTEIVRQFAQSNGFQLTEFSPAQIEEMGDLLGMPAISENGKTTYLPPQWVPTQPGPGILLIDDVNRADDRILRGIMPLLQNRAIMAWALPEKWQIVLTANPDDGHYAVTPLDDALLSRMLHITLRFDIKAWAHWAATRKLDSRGIDFVLTHPDLIIGKRTTARTLTHFFRTLAYGTSPETDLRQIQLLAEAALDSETASAFLQFIRLDAEKIPTPEQILQADNFQEQFSAGLHELIKGPPKRVDLLSALCTRMEIFLKQYRGKPGQRELDNLSAFLLWEPLGRELRFSLARSLAAESHVGFKSVLDNPEVAQAIL